MNDKLNKYIGRKVRLKLAGGKGVICGVYRNNFLVDVVGFNSPVTCPATDSFVEILDEVGQKSYGKNPNLTKLNALEIQEIETEACKLVECYALRWGQALFNALHSKRPDLADTVRATDKDPFYNDARIPEFWEAIVGY